MLTMKIVGTTTEGKPIVGGVARLYFERGLPLCFIFERLIENNLVVSWLDLIKELKDNGVSYKKIHSLISDGIVDLYKMEEIRLIIDNIEHILKELELKNDRSEEGKEDV